MSVKRIPIAAAKDISKKYGQDQVIIMTWDKTTGTTHVISYGKSLESCRQAALGANLLKKTLGFPPEKCNDVPARIKEKDGNIS